MFFFSECMSNRSGGNYRGKINVTRTGRTCQRWDSQWPHVHDVTSAVLPDETLAEAENYCRSPGFDPGGPWCYVTDMEVTWEYCNVPNCGELGGRLHWRIVWSLFPPNANLFSITGYQFIYTNFDSVHKIETVILLTDMSDHYPRLWSAAMYQLWNTEGMF